MIYKKDVTIRMTDFVNESMTKLSNKGYKYTQRRADLLALFDEDENRYFSAKEVQQRIKVVYPKMSFDTIYRNLKLFTEEQMLEETELDGEMMFRKHCDPEIGHHHHFICHNCGKALPVETCPLDFYERQLPGVQIEEHQFQLIGLCAECAVS